MASSNPSDEEIPCSSNSVCDLMEVGDSDVEGGNVEVDESPLKPSLSRNKESLKLKLQMRRPINQLVEQGILPSPNTPPAFACQRVKLERARMGDLLKAKIQQRPSRQELVRQHILEETDPRVAPLLAEKQRMLKRARLADSLNDHLIHRPGPLELVKKNILHAADESIEKAIKEGIVPFKATCEGALPGPSLPTKYVVQEDDSSSDVSSPSFAEEGQGDQSHSQSQSPEKKDSPAAAPVHEQSQSPPAPERKEPEGSPVVLPSPVLEVQQRSLAPAPAPPPIPTQPQPPAAVFAVPIYSAPQQNTQQIKRSSKKISKSKSQSKPKTIKFHEYRGPPSAQHSSKTAEQKRPAESSYELLLQQQQLFLQWQLEWQHRFPKILLPAVSKIDSTTTTVPSLITSSTPVQIISSTPSNSVLILDNSQVYVPQQSQPLQSQPPAPQPQPLPQPQQVQPQQTTLTFTTKNEKLADWRVNELKAELKKRNLPVSGSKAALVERLAKANGSHVETPTQSSSSASSPAPTPTTVISISQGPQQEITGVSSSSNNQQEQLRTVLQQKIQQKLQQKSQSQNQNLPVPVPVVEVKSEQAEKVEIKVESPCQTEWVLKIQESSQPSEAPSFENCLADLLDGTPEPGTSKPAAPTPTTQSSSSHSSHVKSQMVDDVLEILIRNGELPPSAADSATPTPTKIISDPPLPPPLPPTTFAITLPTEIRYRPHPHPPQPQDPPQPEPKAASGSTSIISNLTKEAQALLKIHEPKPKPIQSEPISPMIIDDLLSEALDFPMDTSDYSDWLESFSSSGIDNFPYNSNTKDPGQVQHASCAGVVGVDPQGPRDPMICGYNSTQMETNNNSSTPSNLTTDLWDFSF